MIVTTWTLEMLRRPTRPPRPLPVGVHLELATGVDPEYARFLYAAVGGPWHWSDRLDWSRDRWVDELAVHGTEFWIPYGDGVPLGYVQLQPQPVEDGTQVEIRYFGLLARATGRGLGGALLERAIDAAWSLPERSGVPPVTRVWVHTCSLDGPAARPNYEARGLVLCRTDVHEEDVPAEAVGSWVATGGSAAPA
ncbi:GNAT family N-acetyltransferase [Curtobacterium pusillum]|uniref:GNAT family N-acetyltransferase n=1 Tax=Curtobacterium pusillum TaxID=69373 RepID=UPI0011A0C959|nr:GNAT family N-acetyltransferase [Curtobacterium pusillum]